MVYLKKKKKNWGDRPFHHFSQYTDRVQTNATSMSYISERLLQWLGGATKTVEMEIHVCPITLHADQL